MKEIKTDNVAINYQIIGSGDTTLLFVHGSNIDQTYWKEQVNYFKYEDKNKFNHKGHQDFHQVHKRNPLCPLCRTSCALWLNLKSLVSFYLILNTTLLRWTCRGMANRAKKANNSLVQGFAEDVVTIIKELNLKKIYYEIVGDKSKNGTIKRKKVGGIIVNCFVFQFQYGTIKVVIQLPGRKPIELFQFQFGTIKVKGDDVQIPVTTGFQFQFGTIKVVHRTGV